MIIIIKNLFSLFVTIVYNRQFVLHNALRKDYTLTLILPTFFSDFSSYCQEAQSYFPYLIQYTTKSNNNAHSHFQLHRLPNVTKVTRKKKKAFFGVFFALKWLKLQGNKIVKDMAPSVDKIT